MLLAAATTSSLMAGEGVPLRKRAREDAAEVTSEQGCPETCADCGTSVHRVAPLWADGGEAPTAVHLGCGRCRSLDEFSISGRLGEGTYGVVYR